MLPLLAVIVMLVAATSAALAGTEREVYVYLMRYADRLGIEVRVPVDKTRYGYEVSYSRDANVTAGAVDFAVRGVEPVWLLSAQISLWSYGEYFEIQGSLRVNVSGSRVEFAIIPANVSWTEGGIVRLYPYYDSEEALRRADYASYFSSLLVFLGLDASDAGNYTLHLTPRERFPPGEAFMSIGFTWERQEWILFITFELRDVGGDVRDLIENFYLGIQDVLEFEVPAPSKWPWELLAPDLPFTSASVGVSSRHGMATYLWDCKGISADKVRAAMQYLLAAGWTTRDTRVTVVVADPPRHGVATMTVGDALTLTDEDLASIPVGAASTSFLVTSAPPTATAARQKEGELLLAALLAALLAGTVALYRARR